MVGKTFTYLIGSDSSALFFNSRNDDLNAEEVYSRLVTPVFGKGVAYDVPHNVSIDHHIDIRTVEPPYKGHLGTRHFVLYIEVVLLVV